MTIYAKIYIILTIAGLCYNAYLHGKPKQGNSNFWISLFATVPIWALLIFGGFFN